jgi:translocator protein
MKNAPKIILFIIICELVGIIGAYFSGPVLGGWYVSLAKSPLNPPTEYFGPIWTILYAFMGYAAFLIWNTASKKKEVRSALVLFADLLILNLLWSVIFFGIGKPFAAFVEILALWIVSLLTVLAFFKVSHKAAYFLIPFLVWVSFAAYLNYSIVILNYPI